MLPLHPSKQPVGFKYKDIDKIKFGSVKLEDSVAEHLKSLIPETPAEILEGYINDDELYQKIKSEMEAKMSAAIPKKAKEECPACKSGKHGIDESYCDKYTSQMGLTIYMASGAFINIVRRNDMIVNNAELKKNLTVFFYECFLFDDTNGECFFDIDRLIRHTLNENLKEVSKLLESSETLNAMKIVNTTLDKVNTRRIDRDLNNKIDFGYLDIQQRYYEEKQNYLNQKLAIENNSPKSQPHDLRPNRTDLAYYFYYLRQANIQVTNAPTASVECWKEVGKTFDRNAKNIQKAFNEIIYEKERLKKRRDNNLEYVIDNMLSKHPEALMIAKNELNKAKLNW